MSRSVIAAIVIVPPLGKAGIAFERNRVVAATPINPIAAPGIVKASPCLSTSRRTVACRAVLRLLQVNDLSNGG